MRPGLAILASGQGTTAEAVIKAYAAKPDSPEVRLVIASKASAGILGRVDELNARYNLVITKAVIGKETHPASTGETIVLGQQSIAEEQALIDILNDAKIDLVLLLGYMRRIGTTIVRNYGWQQSYESLYQARMLNTHPGLLPETKGLFGVHVQEHVLEHDLPYGGQTLHIVAEDYDDGPTIREHKVRVEPGDTPDSLFSRVKLVEQESLPGDIEDFIRKRKKYLEQR